MLESALELAATRHWQVFPCRADKRPCTPSGFKDGSNDRDTIRNLWQAFPGPLIGIATGEASGFDVLDLDLEHPEAREWKQDVLLRLPARLTLQVHTRSGGRHFYFQHEPGLRNSAARPVRGVDVRADGGYVIWWPAAGFVVDRIEIAPWPGILLEEIRPKQRSEHLQVAWRGPASRDGGDLSSLLKFVENAQEGERNTILYWAACRCREKIRDGHLTRSEAEYWLTRSALWVGLAPSEIRATIRSALGMP